MQIDILAALPELLHSPLHHSIVQRAQDRGILQLGIHSLRDYTADKQRTIDDYAYGPEAGMVLKPEPIFKAVEALSSDSPYDEVIYMSPDGELFNQTLANELSLNGKILILCGHYKGVDQRVRDHLVTREISIGDYVLSGGEIAAAVVVDALTRLLPGAISDETSALTDSFQDGLLAPPSYTRPAVFRGWEVPEILRSGNFAKINEWQHQQAIERTKRLRPKLYEKYIGKHSIGNDKEATPDSN